jgi:hypothetical protein
MMVTFGSSSRIDAAAVERFRLALIESGQSRLLKRIKGEKLSAALLSLYSQCQVVKPKSPSLVVREK